LAKNRAINIIIEGEIGLNKLGLARVIYNRYSDEDETLTEFILPYSGNSKYSLKIEQKNKTWYEDVKDEIELQAKLFPGTIILPNINEMSLTQQKRFCAILNSLLEKQTYARKYRLIATSEDGLNELATKGLFDEKLFYLLNTAYIDLVPLRYRHDDLQHIFEHLILTSCKKLKKEIHKIEKEVFEFIYSYPWLGNIYELENAVINAITFSSSTILSISDFTSVINKTYKDQKLIAHSTDVLPDNLLLEINYNRTSLEELNKQYVKEILSKFNGNRTKIAEILGITRPTLQKLLH
jgi:DNA-binding NtrC family response regulator